jgi:uncharacterized lipoprotein YddW (UPF0748 family)
MNAMENLELQNCGHGGALHQAMGAPEDWQAGKPALRGRLLHGLHTQGRPGIRLLAPAIFLWCCMAGFAGARADTAAAIDDCSYASDAAAQAAWKPMEGAPPVLTAVLEGSKALRLRCNFSTNQAERAYWDRTVKMNLADCDGIQFRVFCRDTLPVMYFSIYFRSGAGWYHSDFYPDSAGAWNLITLRKEAMGTEGQPAGWDQIRTIRLAAWRGQKTDTEFLVSDLRRANSPDTNSPPQVFEARLARAGQFDGFTNFDDAWAHIQSQGAGNETVARSLASVKALREAAQALAAEKNFSAAAERAATAGEELKNAYYEAQKPLPGEFRAFWCHSAFGVPGLSWDEAIHKLADNGFTAILPNMLSAGVAYYPSKVLPVSGKVAERGDQISQCLAACRKYGVELHVWKLDWNLNGAPREFVEQMRAQHRLQLSDKGKEENWLCPSQPENQQLEIDAWLEVVRNYDVDGIHFDYIRYPGSQYCFCDGCKERFQRAKGVAVRTWPEDVLPGGPWHQAWLDWRRENINTVVKTVSQRARALKPRLKISAAVFRYWNVNRDDVGQDWKLWCDQGWLDFVCPMDYTPSKLRFENMVSQQVAWAGKVPCYPGLGASASSSRFGADRAIEEIAVTRRYHTGGFVIFNYGANEARELLPELGKGMTRVDNR